MTSHRPARTQPHRQRPHQPVAGPRQSPHHYGVGAYLGRDAPKLGEAYLFATGLSRAIAAQTLTDRDGYDGELAGSELECQWMAQRQ